MTRAQAAARIVADLRDRFADIPDTEVNVSTSRGPRIASSMSGPMSLTLTVEIQIDAPDDPEP